MRINRILKRTFAEGPGCRFCIWVQGCNHHCEGCFAVDSWDFSAGTDYSTEEIIQQFLSVKDDVCGITLLGGEPFEQAEELAVIAAKAHEYDKNVITFTGYTYEQLNRSSVSAFRCLLAATDLLIDGKYIKELKDFSKPLIGSSNQKYIFLTDRIKKSEIYSYKNRFEIRNEGGTIRINGMGNTDKLNYYINSLTKGETNE